MTETDIIAISVIFNIILLVHNYIQSKQYTALRSVFVKSFRLAEAIADGKATVHRDSKGFIHIKEVKDETN